MTIQINRSKCYLLFFIQHVVTIKLLPLEQGKEQVFLILLLMIDPPDKLLAFEKCFRGG